MNGIRAVRRKLVLALLLMAMIYVVGTLFYHRVEGWTYLDSVYFLTATVTTIGYGDFTPVTEGGKLFTILIAWIGISLGFFLLYSIMEYRETTVDHKVIKKLRFFRDFVLRKNKNGE